MVWLTDEERSKFASFLYEHAASNEGLVEQMKRVRTPQVIIERYQDEARAAQVIAHMLSSGETMSIGG